MFYDLLGREAIPYRADTEPVTLDVIVLSLFLPLWKASRWRIPWIPVVSS
jgi:hypothetical protein